MTTEARRDAYAAYPPSWVDRLTQRIDRLDRPLWAVYGTAALLLVGVFTGVQAWQGAYVEGGSFAGHIFLALQPLFPVAAVHYLDRVALEAYEKFKPTTTSNEELHESTRYRLTTSPARQAFAASLFGVILYILLFLVIQDPATGTDLARLADSSISLGTFLVYLLVAWFGFGAWFYHTFHQLRQISRLYLEEASADPFHPDPLHALSAISSRTAIIMLALSYGWVSLGASNIQADAGSFVALIGTNVFVGGLSLLIFVWPLWGAHRLLETAKAQALAANAAHFKKAVAELHRRVSSGAMKGIDEWEKALSGLEVERAHLRRLPTWPWSPGSLRNMIAALIVPIVVWIAQFGLQRLLE